MVKHAQIICRLLPTNCLSVSDQFVRLVLKGLRLKLMSISQVKGRLLNHKRNEFIVKETFKDNSNESIASLLVIQKV